MISGKMFGPEMFGRPLLEGLSQGIVLITEVWLNFIGMDFYFQYMVCSFFIKLISNFWYFLLDPANCPVFLLILQRHWYKQMILPILVLLTPPMALGILNLTEHFNKNYLHSDNANRLGISVILCSIIILLITSNWSLSIVVTTWMHTNLRKLFCLQWIPMP